VAPGMNPAHGEPGHRCDIPTGTSLKTDALKNVDASSASKKDPEKK